MDLRVSQPQLEKLSDISISMGQVFFASVFIDPLMNGSSGITGIIGGLIMAFLSWLFSVLIIKNNNV